MDWARAIEINHSALTRIVAAIIAMVGLGVVARLPRPVYRAALGMLRPAEAAVRRLIVIAARGVVVKPSPIRPMPQGLKLARTGGGGTKAFQLFDTRKRFAVRRAGPKVAPRIFGFRGGELVPLLQSEAPSRAERQADGLVDAKRLGLRLQAIKLALENLPAQAKRFKRWQARRCSMASPKFASPLRPGPPPGHREKPQDDIDRVLNECHDLAWETLKVDSS